MYEYKFIRIDLKTGFSKMKPSEDYHEVIREQAEEGWRFVQAFAPTLSFHPNPTYIEMIFERPRVAAEKAA